MAYTRDKQGKVLKIINTSVECGSSQDPTPVPLLASIWEDSKDNRHQWLRGAVRVPYPQRAHLTRTLKVRHDDPFHYLGLPKSNFYIRSEAELSPDNVSFPSPYSFAQQFVFPQWTCDCLFSRCLMNLSRDDHPLRMEGILESMWGSTAAAYLARWEPIQR